MPDWGIIILVLGILIIFGIIAWYPLLTWFRSKKFQEERTRKRKISIDNEHSHHRNLLLQNSIHRPFYTKYFTNLTNKFKVPVLNTELTFDLDLFESSYQNINKILTQECGDKNKELINYLLDTHLNILLTTIFSDITNNFIIPQFEMINEDWAILNDVSDEYYAQWILDYRAKTIDFICLRYLPYICQEIKTLLQTKDLEKYSIAIRTIITTEYQAIIFNSLEQTFVNYALELINNSSKMGPDVDIQETKNSIINDSSNFRPHYDKIFQETIKIEKINMLLSQKNEQV